MRATCRKSRLTRHRYRRESFAARQKLVAGRECLYFGHFRSDFAVGPKHSIPEKDRAFYAAACASPGVRAGFEYFRAFDQDGKDFAAFAQKKPAMPMLVLSGEKSGGEFLINKGRMVDATSMASSSKARDTG